MERPGSTREPVSQREGGIGPEFLESEREEEKVSIKRRGQVIRSVQLLVDPQPGTAARGEG